MKNKILIVLVAMVISCKEKVKQPIIDTSNDTIIEETTKEKIIEAVENTKVEIENKPSIKALKAALKAKGFKTMEHIDGTTKDTILLQQYFMAFLKNGPIRGQNEEETAELHKQHIAHLNKMYKLGYAGISGPFKNNDVIKAITIYNVPTLKMADSLAKADPMVKAGRIEIEIYPWWAAKSYTLK